MKKVILLVLSAILVIGSLAGCTQTTSGSGNSNVIKIGVFEPMTGANAAGGK